MAEHVPTSISMEPTDTFVSRHIGPGPAEISEMLKNIGYSSLDALIDTAIPPSIRLKEKLDIGPERSEHSLLLELAEIAAENQLHRSFIGMGYHGCITPGVIQRNILDNPGWYTQYTPYQAEISQGRLEMLLNFQTMVSDLTGLPIANASLLDEGTAAAEAMSMCARLRPRGSGANEFLVASDCHPQTIEIVRHRASALAIQIREQDPHDFAWSENVFGALLQYPTTHGLIEDYKALCDAAHAQGAKIVVAADILALTLLRPPGEFGADIAIGSTQRMGVPMGYGGPHAAYLSTTEENRRQMPGRLIGLSVDAQGKPALRMALQTREQHIRRDRATSNICTAQVLLAVIAAAYAVYHGPDGLRRIAHRVRAFTDALKRGLSEGGHKVAEGAFFDTLKVTPGDRSGTDVLAAANKLALNLRGIGDGSVGISLDETVVPDDLDNILQAFGVTGVDIHALLTQKTTPLPSPHQRTSEFLKHPTFHRFHSETEMLRYIRRLESRDLSLTRSMIPLGSCTMKLNGTTEMVPITWPEFNQIHPFVPTDQAKGYRRLFEDLERWLGLITGFPSTSLQPNAGSQGEYAGLLVIRAFHESRGEGHRNICLIPTSAHGTNPASAVMAGMTVVAIRCDDRGNIDLDNLREKAQEHQENLGALMITYPSTHGVFENEIRTICSVVHDHGGQVYMDGANMNAQVGLCRPGDVGADVCHLNLHKTFCIPHGGGGPGMGPICVAAHLAPFLPGHPVIETGGEKAIGAISAAPWGSPSILPISWSYIALMGTAGLQRATEVAILNANYIAKRLESHYPILYRGNAGLVAHECIIDLRPLKALAGIQVDDVAKRLIDYGFHAPTMSWPVPGTMMIEPTESEAKRELDRFCDAMIQIREEVQQIADGTMDAEDNPLKNAPHTAEAVVGDEWTHPYSRQLAAYPTAETISHKFWPPVGRVNNSYGDRNLVCTCPSVEDFMAE